MAPEQLTGQADTIGDPAKVDVWGLLVSWLQLLTGKDLWFWLGYDTNPRMVDGRPCIMLGVPPECLEAFWTAPNSQQRLRAALDTHYGPLLPPAVTPALEFFKWALVVDVAVRPTAAEVLAHPYISSPRQHQQQ
jgi:serine/threonine protein kinase